MPTPQRLPLVNNDDGVWGDIIRQFLMKEHFNDDTDNAINGGHKTITIQAGTATAGTAPLKFTSGTLLSTPEAGAIEFNSDTLYFTQTTTTTRKKIAAYDDASGATGDIYYRNSGGSFVRLGIGSTGDVLKVSGGLPSWGAASGGSPGGSSGQLQYNNSGVFDGTTDITYATGTLTFGGDATLYRSAAQNLKTDGNLRIGNTLIAKDGATEQVYVGYVASGKGGLLMGSTLDTNLYRSAADSLATDDAFTVIAPSSTTVGSGTSQITISPVTPVSGTSLLYFNTDRPWGFTQDATGAGASLALRAYSSDKYFEVYANGSSVKSLSIYASTTAGNNAVGILGPPSAGQGALQIASAGTGGLAMYNTTDQTTNYERLRTYWSSNILNIKMESGGTGTQRDFVIGTNNNSVKLSDTSGIVIERPNNTALNNIITLGNGTLTGSSGVQNIFRVQVTANQSSTAGYTGLLLNITETSTGSGTKSLADLQIGGSSKFKVDNTGAVTATGAITGSNLSGTNTGDQVISDATISTTDITTNNVSTTKHGFAPKAPNDVTRYLDGTGAWSMPSNLTSSSKTTNYTIIGTDVVILADATSGAVTITLPAAASFANYRFYVKRIDTTSNTCTVARTNPNTIDGQTSINIDPYTSLMVLSNGSNWFIL